MAIENRPQPGRAVVSAREAARMLRRDVRTVRRMIQAGDIEGGAHLGPKQRRWYVYLDQLTSTSGPARVLPVGGDHAGDASLDAELRVLRAENDDLRAQVVAANEAARLMMAAHAMLLEAVDQHRVSAVEMAGAADGYRMAAEGYQVSAERYRQAATGFQATSERLMSVIAQYRDALSQFTTPGNLGSLTDE
ncbi:MULTISPECIES: helix-turn-helix domain-containing protein [Mycobacterium]|nr:MULTISPECIES: helix-turn-helix domain-containing protein [Mycobacterium]MDA3641981.1 helix-turn-helix domain-containing protein [Mycobacterium xenopi]MDA3659868.1 helix-turn-helix domain-containing protein [Mycobacterium xenopi]MDA3664413.1 helix-turn-helix domain-containing protein [Mycobacterium xenopi]SPX88541.1 Uncharacterised protein [Mycobacterium xenopi]